MRLLFNDLITLRERSGVGAYAFHLLEHLPREAKDLSLIRLSETLSGLPLKLLSAKLPSGKSSGAKSKWKSYAQKVVSQYVRLSSAWQSYDLYHEPDALALPIAAPTAVTVHDLSVSLFPNWHPEYRVRNYEAQLERTLQVARHFFADSMATKNDMQKYWRVSPEKIDVIPLAPRPMFRRLSAHELSQTALPKTPSGKYFLFVGTLEPRKNVKGLIRAYRSLDASLREQYPLFLAGGRGWKNEDLSPLFGNDVRWLGYVSDKDLVPLMNGALAMVYPSFYEGFGLPPLEAMACGVPVISSHRGSLKEVVGPAVYVIEPEDETQIAKAMAAVACDEALRKNLVESANSHLKNFSWEVTARQTIAGYRKALCDG